jgi:hypothetical protein
MLGNSLQILFESVNLLSLNFFHSTSILSIFFIFFVDLFRVIHLLISLFGVIDFLLDKLMHAKRLLFLPGQLVLFAIQQIGYVGKVVVTLTDEIMS